MKWTRGRTDVDQLLADRRLEHVKLRRSVVSSSWRTWFDLCGALVRPAAPDDTHCWWARGPPLQRPPGRVDTQKGLRIFRLAVT